MATSVPPADQPGIKNNADQDMPIFAGLVRKHERRTEPQIYTVEQIARTLGATCGTVYANLNPTAA